MLEQKQLTQTRPSKVVFILFFLRRKLSLFIQQLRDIILSFIILLNINNLEKVLIVMLVLKTSQCNNSPGLFIVRKPDAKDSTCYRLRTPYSINIRVQTIARHRTTHRVRNIIVKHGHKLSSLTTRHCCRNSTIHSLAVTAGRLAR